MAYIDMCDAERMSIHELNKMVGKVGHRNATILYYYLEPVADMRTGLRELSTDTHVRTFCDWAYKFKVMEVYCHHLTDPEIEELKNAVIIESPDKGKKKTGVVIEEVDEEECITRYVGTEKSSRRDCMVGNVGGEKRAKNSQRDSNVRAVEGVDTVEKVGVKKQQKALMQLVMLGQKRVNMKLTMVVVNTKVNMK